ncbi:MAG: substrate-binding domain-containing protein [Pseudomonadota bacterium]
MKIFSLLRLRFALALSAVLIMAACSQGTDLSTIEKPEDGVLIGVGGPTDKIRIVGSSTVAPFSITVAEYFGALTPHPTPIVETTGTGGGFKVFCAGLGPQTPSLVNASRRIKPSEAALCAENLRQPPVMFQIGFDGIVLANTKAAPRFNLSKAQIYQALAAELPDSEGGWRDNPHTLWSDVSPDLPASPILVSGPPPTSGTRDSFATLAMEPGALALPEMVALQRADPDTFLRRAHTVRTDGRWIDSGENDSSIINTLLRNEEAIGVLGYSFLEQNLDRIQAAEIDGVAPEFEAIASGDYAISRSMYVYLKRDNLAFVPGLADYMVAHTLEDAFGPDGYLVEKGLIPLTPERREEMRAKAIALSTP